MGSVISVPAPAFGHPAPIGVGSGCASYSGVTGVTSDEPPLYTTSWYVLFTSTTSVGLTSTPLRATASVPY